MNEGKRQKAKGKRQKLSSGVQVVMLAPDTTGFLLSPSITGFVENPLGSAALKADSRRRAAKWRRCLLPFAFCLLPFAFLPAAGFPCPAQNSVATPSATNWSFNYKFENKRFYVPMMEIDLGVDGAGELRFQRGESDDLLDHKFKLLPTTLARIRQLLEASRFLDSSDTYQAEKDFSHLGWVTLLARQNERERKVRFNYTQNPQISELADIFRGIATEEMHLFDIETSEQFQPLDLPRLLDSIENDLKLQRITEPERLLAKLQEVASNDTQPLIARNHAMRIVSDIKKGKFKTTMRK